MNENATISIDRYLAQHLSTSEAQADALRMALLRIQALQQENAALLSELQQLRPQTRKPDGDT